MSDQRCALNHEHLHGENATCYVQGKCRCSDCRRGRAEYEYWRKHMRDAGKPLLVDPTGTIRRLNALAAIGWSGPMIAKRAGVTEAGVRHWTEKKRITPATAERVRRLYDELSMTLPHAVSKDERGAVSKAKRYARNHGWPPPLAWDDDTIDDPTAGPAWDGAPEVVPPVAWCDRYDEVIVVAAISGDRPRLSPLERREVVARLNARNWSAERIGDYIGCTSRTVQRIRGELGLTVADQMTIREAA